MLFKKSRGQDCIMSLEELCGDDFEIVYDDELTQAI